MAALFILLPLFASAEHAEEQTISKLTFSGVAGEVTHTAMSLVLEQIYANLHIAASFEFTPGRRSLMLANSGSTDGEIGRRIEAIEPYPNLIPVPTPILSVKARVFTRSITRDIQRWSDLEGLRIGIVRGAHYAEEGTKGLDPIQLDDLSRLFVMLAAGNLDVVISLQRSGLAVAQKVGEAGIHIIGEPLFEDNVFHMVHQKHEVLIPQLDAQFKAMTQSGELAEHYSDYFEAQMKN